MGSVNPKDFKSFSGYEGSGAVSSIAISPDGKKVLAANNHFLRKENVLVLWDIISENEVPTIYGHKKGINEVSFSPDGKTILTCSSDKTAILWDVSSKNQVALFAGHMGR